MEQVSTFCTCRNFQDHPYFFTRPKPPILRLVSSTVRRKKYTSRIFLYYVLIRSNTSYIKIERIFGERRSCNRRERASSLAVAGFWYRPRPLGIAFVNVMNNVRPDKYETFAFALRKCLLPSVLPSVTSFENFLRFYNPREAQKPGK